VLSTHKGDVNMLHTHLWVIMCTCREACMHVDRHGQLIVLKYYIDDIHLWLVDVEHSNCSITDI
jgi:hypothetical protein